jgi:hypothetical protein
MLGCCGEPLPRCKMPHAHRELVHWEKEAVAPLDVGWGRGLPNIPNMCRRKDLSYCFCILKMLGPFPNIA